MNFQNVRIAILLHFCLFFLGSDCVGTFGWRMDHVQMARVLRQLQMMLRDPRVVGPQTSSVPSGGKVQVLLKIFMI